MGEDPVGSVDSGVVDSGVAFDAGVKVGDGVGGIDCLVCSMAAETVSATMTSKRWSAVGVGAGADAAGSPGAAHANRVAKKIRAMKKIRLLFIIFSFSVEMKKPLGYYSREALLIHGISTIRQHIGEICVFQSLHQIFLRVAPN